MFSSNLNESHLVAVSRIHLLCANKLWALIIGLFLHETSEKISNKKECYQLLTFPDVYYIVSKMIQNTIFVLVKNEVQEVTAFYYIHCK